MLNPGAGPQLSAELVEFLQSGLPMEVATCDAARVPAISSGHGVSIDLATREARLLLSREGAERTLKNLGETGQIAAVFARPIDHHSIQLKGRFLGAEDPTPADVRVRERYRDLLVEHLAVAGVPRSLSKRLGSPHSVVVRFRITDVFEQTPGPNAGRAVGR